MTKQLRALLVAIGVGSVGAIGVSIFTPDKGVTWAQLKDAGLDDICNIKLASCPVKLSPEALAYAVDAGIFDAGYNYLYAQLKTPLAVCRPPQQPAFIVLPKMPSALRGGFDFYNLDLCKIRNCGASDCNKIDRVAPFLAQPLPCVYLPLDAGNDCHWSDGGVTIPRRYVGPDWAAVGADCVPTQCVAADSNAPVLVR